MAAAATVAPTTNIFSLFNHETMEALEQNNNFPKKVRKGSLDLHIYLPPLYKKYLNALCDVKDGEVISLSLPVPVCDYITARLCNHATFLRDCSVKFDKVGKEKLTLRIDKELLQLQGTHYILSDFAMLKIEQYLKTTLITNLKSYVALCQKNFKISKLEAIELYLEQFNIDANDVDFDNLRRMIYADRYGKLSSAQRARLSERPFLSDVKQLDMLEVDEDEEE